MKRTPKQSRQPRGQLSLMKSPLATLVAGRFTFIDLFAGIGGMRLGFEAVGGRCVFTCEWDSYARKTYCANWPDVTEEEIGRDIRSIDIAQIPAHDVLCAGFPCQPFSIAGVSKKNALGQPHGFECETQGTLFHNLAEIIKFHRPPAFLLENVKNLRSHDGGNTWKVIRRTLSAPRSEGGLGYDVHAAVVDARPWVPQHRERLFIVGFRTPQPDFSFDELENDVTATYPTLRRILHEYEPVGKELPFTTAKRRVNSKYTLTDHLWNYLQQYALKHRAKGNGFGFGLVGPDHIARTLSARYYKDGSEILIEPKKGSVGNPRRLTPRECSRLMGFDHGNRIYRIPVSDTRAYKQFGNAVVPLVVEAIARRMKRHVLAIRKSAPAEAASVS